MKMKPLMKIAALISGYLFTTALLAQWPAATDAENAFTNRVDDVWKQLIKGNFTPLDQSFQNKDIRLLWAVFGNSTYPWDKEPNREQIHARARELLLRSPGAEEYLGNVIEEASTNHQKSNIRGKSFSLLGQLGSPKAIAQLGRFILDDRNPLPPWIIPGKTFGPTPNPNSMWAGWALNEALGEESPWKPYRNQNGQVFQSPAAPLLTDVMKQWWIETGSKKYGLGIPPAVHPTPKPVAQPPPVIDPGPAPSEPWAWEMPAIIALVLLSALLVFFKRRPRAAG